MTDTSADTIAFAEKVFAILNEGHKSATYKYAVLMGLLDLCCEYHDDHGFPPQSVTTAQLARKVLEYYWPQSMPFPETRRPLRQYSVKTQQAEIISLIWKKRREHAAAVKTPHQLERHEERAFNSLLRAIERTIVQEPLPRLHNASSVDRPFIYSIWWRKEVPMREFRAGSNLIHFIDGAERHLVKLRGLLRPMLQQEWTRWVSANTGVQDKLGKYLFPESRVPLDKLRGPLLDLQDDRCFYCGGKVRKDPAVDHFLPWARTHNDNLGNLVVAHSKCNLSKSDYYASSDHLKEWVARLRGRADDLKTISEDAYWPFDGRASLGLARGIYLNLPGGVRLWRAKKEFEDYERKTVARALGVS